MIQQLTYISFAWNYSNNTSFFNTVTALDDPWISHAAFSEQGFTTLSTRVSGFHGDVRTWAMLVIIIRDLHQRVSLWIAGIVAAVQQIVVFASWWLKRLVFVSWLFAVSVPFHFSLFHRWSNSKSPQTWRSRIELQSVLLGSGFHALFSSSILKIASKGSWVKLWKIEARFRDRTRIVHTNTSWDHTRKRLASHECGKHNWR